MAGQELGLPAFASMSGIHIIQGKPALGSNIIATLIDNDPRYDYKIVTHTEKVCTIEFYKNAVGAMSIPSDNEDIYQGLLRIKKPQIEE